MEMSLFSGHLLLFGQAAEALRSLKDELGV